MKLADRATRSLQQLFVARGRFGRRWVTFVSLEFAAPSAAVLVAAVVGGAAETGCFIRAVLIGAQRGLRGAPLG